MFYSLTAIKLCALLSVAREGERRRKRGAGQAETDLGRGANLSRPGVSASCIRVAAPTWTRRSFQDTLRPRAPNFAFLHRCVCKMSTRELKYVQMADTVCTRERIRSCSRDCNVIPTIPENLQAGTEGADKRTNGWTL